MYVTYTMCITLTQLNEQVHCLQYDYIFGQIKPSNLRQFASIMKDLNILHVKNFVHGDIRKENLRFSRDCEEVWIATQSHKPSLAGCIPAGDIK